MIETCTLRSNYVCLEDYPSLDGNRLGKVRALSVVYCLVIGGVFSILNKSPMCHVLSFVLADPWSAMVQTNSLIESRAS